MGCEHSGVNSPVPLGSVSTSASTSSPSTWSSLVSRLSMMLLMSAASFFSVDVAAWLSAFRDISGACAQEPRGAGERGQGCHHLLCNTRLKETTGNAQTQLPSFPLPTFIPTIPILHTQCQIFRSKATNHITAWLNPRLNSPGAASTRSGCMEEELIKKISRHFCYMFFLWLK